ITRFILLSLHGSLPISRGRGGRDVELPQLTADIADVYLVDVSVAVEVDRRRVRGEAEAHVLPVIRRAVFVVLPELRAVREVDGRSEEHTSELQSPDHLV